MDKREIDKIFYIILMAVAVYMFTYQIKKTQNYNELVDDINDKKLFKETIGTVLVSDTEFTYSECKTFERTRCEKNKPVILYKYKVKDKTYNSHKIKPGDGPSFYNKIDAILFAQKYPVGSQVKVIYNTKNPKESYLINGEIQSYSENTSIFIYLIFFMFSFYGFLKN